MKSIFTILLTCFCLNVFGTAFPLVVSGRNLVDQNGQPFFLTGDAPQWGWLQSASNFFLQYLSMRSAQGFNALWFYPVDKVDQTNAPLNFYGDTPFDGADFTSPDATYWNRVDAAINEMTTNGFLIVIDPAYAGHSSSPLAGYVLSLTGSSDSTMMAYGVFLANRYKAYPNIMWSLGGDADPNVANLYKRYDDIAVAIHSNAPNQLITIEATRFLMDSGTGAPLAGYSSMDACQVAFGSNNPSWLGLNWVYKDYTNSAQGAWTNYFRSGAIPAILGEDWYELEHGMTAYMQRNECYWEVLGGCSVGRFFGNADIYSLSGWQTQTNSPGSLSQLYMSGAVRGVPFQYLVPDANHTIVSAGFGTLGLLNYCTSAWTTNFGLVYQVTNSALTVQMTNLNANLGGSSQIVQIDPASGSWRVFAQNVPNSGTYTLNWNGVNSAGDPDWVYLFKPQPTATTVTATSATLTTLHVGP